MSTRGQFNTKSPTIKRILREASELSTTPSPDYYATPLETNLFEWHFILRGPPSPSPYADGLYHGRIVLPPTYPLRPPSFRFLTPTGRFETNREICLSISGHHEETWQPAWGIRTALVALRSFMDQEAKGQVGGLDTEEGVRKRLARDSRGWACAGCGGRSNEVIMREVVEEVEALEKREGNVGEEGEKKRRERVEEVPAELRLGYRDEMTERKDGGGEGKDGVGEGEEEREGGRERVEGEREAVRAPEQVGGRARIVATRTPTPTRTVPMALPPRAANLVAINSNDGVPPWLDKAIGGVMACLIFLVLKKIMGL